MKHLEDEVQENLNSRKEIKAIVLHLEYFRVFDQNTFDNFMEYARSILKDSSGSSGISANARNPSDLHLKQLDSKTLKLLWSKAASLLKLKNATKKSLG